MRWIQDVDIYDIQFEKVELRLWICSVDIDGVVGVRFVCVNYYALFCEVSAPVKE